MLGCSLVRKWQYLQFGRHALLRTSQTERTCHQIRKLEDALGATLLTRARNGAGTSRTEVTADGAALLQAVDAAFTQLGAACEAVRERARRTRPVLVIAASGSVTSLWLAPLLAAFAARHPSVQWRASFTGALPEGDERLFSETVFPVCSPSLRLAGHKDDLLRHNLLQEDHGASAEMDWST